MASVHLAVADESELVPSGAQAPIASEPLQLENDANRKDPEAATSRWVTELQKIGAIVNRKALYSGVIGTRRVLLGLKERIKLSRKKNEREAKNFWLGLKYIWWPRITRVFRPVPNVELFRNHIKQVESHFGTAVASYFVLLRWLFYMNLAIFGVWLLFVLVPQFVVEPYLREQRPKLPCIADNSTYKCPSGFNTTPHFLVSPTCASLPSDAVKATFCAGDHNTTVYVLPNVTQDCLNNSLEEYYLCPPYHPSFLSLIDLITGRGGYSDTWLFLGHYVNFTGYDGVTYNRPVAYLVCTVLVYGISFVMLIVSLGRAYVDNTVKFSPFIKANFSNAVFSAWDYKITNPRAVKTKKVFIRTELQEELATYNLQWVERKNFMTTILIRIATNSLVIVLMVGCGAAIIAATNYSWSELVSQDLNAVGLIVPILIIASIIILPIIFHVIADFEQYRTQNGNEAMTLIRSSFVRIFTLLIYLVAAYAAIACTQNTTIQATLLNTSTCVNQCWETFIGQQFYNLLILEFLFVSIFTVVYESLRHCLHKLFHHRVRHKILKSIFSKASFSISDSVNDLVYYQLLMWLGLFFCPALPAFQVIIMFVTFYIKKYSLMINLKLEKDGLFRASSTIVVSTVIFLIVLGGSLFPVGYAVSRFQPSVDCGPFRTKATFLSVIDEAVEASSVGAKEFLHYVSSSGFIVPFNMILITLLCISCAIVVAKKKLLRLTIAHLDAEGLSLINIEESILPALAELRHQSEAAQAPIRSSSGGN